MTPPPPHPVLTPQGLGSKTEPPPPLLRCLGFPFVFRSPLCPLMIPPAENGTRVGREGPMRCETLAGESVYERPPWVQESGRRVHEAHMITVCADGPNVRCALRDVHHIVWSVGAQRASLCSGPWMLQHKALNTSRTRTRCPSSRLSPAKGAADGGIGARTKSLLRPHVTQQGAGD